MSNKRAPAGGLTLNGPVKGQGAGPPPGPNPNSGKKFLEREKQLLQLMNEHVQDRAGRQSYDQIQDDLQTKTQESEELKSQLETAKKDYEEELSNTKNELAKQQGAVQTLLVSHEKRILELNEKSRQDNEQLAELSRAKEEIETLKGKLNIINREKDRFEGECDQLKREVREGKDKLRELRRECQKQKIDLEEQADELKKSRKVSDQLSQDLGVVPFNRIDRLQDFKNLAVKFHNLVWNTMRDKNLPFRDDDTSLQLFIDVPGPLLHGIPQVPSNSLPARYMRCALVEAVIAHTLSTQVFNNSSLAAVKLRSTSKSDSVDLDPIVKGIDALSERHYSLEATIIQWQLVKVCRHLNASRKIASKATQKVCDIIEPWIAEDSEDPSAKTSVETFAEQLSGLFLEAAELWQLLQRTRVRPTAVTGNTGGEWDYQEDAWPEYDEAEMPPLTPTTGGAVTDQNDNETSRRWSYIITRGYPTTIPITPLFPQIVAENEINVADDDDEYDNIIFDGRALFPMQSVLLAARKELAVQQEQQMRPNSPLMVRRYSEHGKRRQSKVEMPAAPLLRDGQGQGPSQQAETNRSSGGASASKSNANRRPSISSQTGTQPPQQRSTVSDSDRASSTVSSSRRSRRDEKGPPNPTMSESSNRSKRSGTVGGGDRGNG